MLKIFIPIYLLFWFVTLNIFFHIIIDKIQDEIFKTIDECCRRLFNIDGVFDINCKCSINEMKWNENVRNRLKLKNLHQKKLAKNNWLSYKNRKRFGASATLIPQLRKWRPMQFRNFTRLTPSQFDDLFIAVDIGAPGRHSDSGVFMSSNFGKKIWKNLRNIETYYF
jgi:hypothetical protein